MVKAVVVLLLTAWTVCWAQAPNPGDGRAETRRAARSSPAAPAASKTRATGAPMVVKAGYAVTIGPVPTWVVPTPLPVGAPPEAAPMHYRLIEEQLRVDAGTAAEYVHIVRVVNQSAGLGPAAQFELEYNPAFESVVLHGLEVVRDGQRLQRLQPNRVEILQREKQLEQQVYDGRITVSIVLEDVRVGDEIDLRYTRFGQNPVFAGKYVRNDWLATDRGPVRQYRTRLLAPEARQIHQAVGPVGVTVSSNVVNGWRETVFVREQVPQLRLEPGAPFSTFRGEFLQLSEFADWAEVAAWGDKLFSAAASGSKAAERAAAIREAQPGQAAQVLEALRFVQQDVRYFGVEIGPGSHKPNPADQVLQQRFGDCKDKVTLLTTLLRALQVPVRPVLVSTRLRERLDGWIPSPLVFDHVIARVDLDGKALYLDPTRSHQSGPLAVRPVVGMGKGLELAPGITALTALPSALEAERMRVEDHFTVRQFTEPVVLESRIVYRGDLAEAFREAISTQGIAAVGDALGAPYVRAYPQLKRLAPSTAEAVDGDDAVAIVQRFELPDFWRFPEQRLLVGDVVLWGPVDMLLPPKMETRRQALLLAYPGITRHVATLTFPEDVYQQEGARSSEEGDGHFRLLLKHASTRRETVFTAEARITTDQVAPAQWQAYSGTLAKTLPKLGNTVAVPAVPLARMEAFRAELRSLEDQLRRGRLKVATATQAQSHYRVATLTAQLDGGRLAAPLKAQALVERGIALDHLGRQNDAKADFDAAMALQPESLEALNAAASNAQGRGDFERAVELAGRVLARQPHDAEALGTRALARYLAGQVNLARVDWEEMLEDRSNVRRGYPLVLLALATRRTGGDVVALKQRYPQDLWPTEWPRAVVEQTFEGGDARALLAAAKAQKNAAEAQTEANFYLAELAASGGDLGKARDYWQNTLDYGVVEFVEYSAARQRLKEQP